MEGLLSPWHLLIISVVTLLVFGPSKLPEIGRQVGRGIREFRRFQDSVRTDLGGFLDHEAAPPSLPSTPPPVEWERPVGPSTNGESSKPEAGDDGHEEHRPASEDPDARS